LLVVVVGLAVREGLEQAALTIRPATMKAHVLGIVRYDARDEQRVPTVP
jgi:hypothetical protein